MSTVYNGFLTDIYDICPFFKCRGNSVNYYFSKLNAANKTILELGTATGSITIPLAEAGYIVDTVDSSADMQEAAKSKLKGYDKKTSERITFILNDVTEFTPQRKYGTVIIPDSLLSVILEEKDRTEILQMCYDALVEDGVIILDVYNPIKIMKTEYKERSRFRDKNNNVYIVTASHSIKKDVQLHYCNYEYKKWHDKGDEEPEINIEIVYRYMYPDRIKEMLKKVGFAGAEVKEIFDGNINFITAGKTKKS